MIVSKSPSFLFAVFVVAACQTATIEPPPSQYTDENLTLTTENDRDIPIRVLTPVDCQNICPLIIFSHGAFAAYDRYDALLIPLVQAGYRIAAPNHTDSEEHPERDQHSMEDAHKRRFEDYLTISTKIEAPYTVAMGHSFGAMIAQIAGGAGYKDSNTIALTDRLPVPDRVVAISPPGPFPGIMDASGWAETSVSTLVITGTADIVPGIADAWEDHLVSFEAAPDGLAFALIYDEMDHYFNGAFGRETEAATYSRSRAIAHLNDSILAFLDLNLEPPTYEPGAWQSRAQDFVEARTH